MSTPQPSFEPRTVRFSRRIALLAGGGGLLAAFGLAACSSSVSSSGAAPTSSAASGPSSSGHITSATAITQVYGSGQKLVALALAYDASIASARLDAASFTVTDRKITKVYANTSAALADHGVDGSFVIIEMSLTDEAAALWPSSLSNDANAGPPSGSGGGSGMPSAGGGPSSAPSGGTGGGPGGGGPGGGGPTIEAKAASATVTQTGTVTTSSGTVLPADSTAVATSHVVNLIVDDFKQLSYTDPTSGATLPYNLFVPADYDKSKTYPLVLFMHDATVTGTNPLATLVQGLGAVSFASPAAQAKQQAIVVAPLYATQPVTSDFTTTSAMDATVNLVKSLSTEYSVDTTRLYSTGQSGGAMLAIAMNIAYPDLFAASWIVAGQWDPAKVAPISKKKLWVTVAEGDAEAYPTENRMIPVLEKGGATVSRATWNGKAGATALDADARKQAAKGTSLNYSVFTKGTVEPAGAVVNNLNEHLATWQVAYTIDAIRDWVYAQRA